MKRVELLGIIQSAAEESLLSCGTEENPFSAWARFIDHLDAIGRQMIGDKLAEQGRNRYTGEESG